jgi:hypothetical protein
MREVAGDDGCRLRAQELTPAGARASRRRPEGGAREQPADRARRDREAELVELAGDALVAPARVLTRQPQHKLARSAVDRRAPWPRARVGPSPPHKLAVPTQQRLRRDEQAMATRGRQQPACGGQQRPVTRSQLRALALTTQNLQLMAQQEQLDVLDVDASAPTKQQLQQRHEDQVHERKRPSHDPLRDRARRRRSTTDQRFGTLHAPARSTSAAAVAERSNRYVVGPK